MSSTPGPAPRGTHRVQSVERAIRLLRAVARAGSEGARVAALSDDCGINRATAWRLLTTLEADELVTCDRHSGRWTLGRGLHELTGPTWEKSVLRASQSVLEQVAATSGETAALAMMRSTGLTYVAEVAATAVVAATWRGRVVPLHATSTGKAWLAAQPEDHPVEHVRPPLERFTAHTIVDPAALADELLEIRRTGYGVCRGEFEATAYGVSAAVHGHDGGAVAVLSIWGPKSRFGPERFPEAGAIVVAGAARISESLSSPR